MSIDQTNNLLKKDGDTTAMAAQSKFQDEATEHTLAGAAIGVVRDFIPGLKGTASSNDQIAQIAADTVASLPMVKTVAGGAIRATMLIDLSKNLESNVTGFGVNFVEGAALNKVSRLAMPESGLNTALQSRFGTGLVSEAATHLTAGFGFGAIRTGFSADSWKDGSGNFDLKTGAENLIRGGSTGALINLPAGMLGARVARASSVALENSIVSPRIASVLTGVGSGYAAGGVYGGVDAVMSGKSFGDVLKGINDGGMIGAATGGVIGAFDKGGVARTDKLVRTADADSRAEQATNRANAESQSVQAGESQPIKINSDRVRGKNLVEKTEFDGEIGPLTRLQVEPAMYDLMAIKASEVPRIVDFKSRLTSYTVQPEVHNEATPGSKGPWENFSDYEKNGMTPVEQAFRVYKIDGVKTELGVPESYAQQLDEVRTLRIRGEKPSLLDDLPRGNSISVQNMVKTNNVEVFKQYFTDEQAQQILPIIGARIALSEHPLGNRALPEDIVSLLQEQPANGKITRINLWPDRSPHDPWFSQTFKEDGFKASATAKESAGQIDFYASNRSDAKNSSIRDGLRKTFSHERGHLYTPSDKAYEDASLLDKDGYYVSKYSRKNDSERWSEDTARGMLTTDVDGFFAFCDKAPVRAVVMARELHSQIESAYPAERGIYTEEILKRLNFIDHNVTPLARQDLAEHLYSNDAEKQMAALRLLRTFGTKDELDAVVHAAHKGSSDDVRRLAFDQAVIWSGPNPKKQFDFVWQQGQPSMPARELAIKQMRNFGRYDERAASYAHLLEYAGEHDLPNLAKQVTRMFTDEGSLLAYEMAMKQGANTKGYQREIALAALQEVPSLRVRALQTLNNQQPDGIAPVVRRFVNDSDPEVAKLAQDVLRGVQLRERIADVQKVLDKTGDVDARSIDALGASGDNLSIPPLLQVVIRGSDAARAQALDALGKFDPNIVKFQARMAKQGHTAQETQNLKYVLNYNLAKHSDAIAADNGTR